MHVQLKFGAVQREAHYVTDQIRVLASPERAEFPHPRLSPHIPRGELPDVLSHQSGETSEGAD